MRGTGRAASAAPARFEDFEELLLAVADSLESGSPAAFRGSDPQGGLFDEAPTRGRAAGGTAELALAERRDPLAAAALIRSRSPRLFGALLRTAFCAEPPVEALLEVTAAVGRRGDGALGDFTSPSLRTLVAAARAFNREVHRLVGFARFEADSEGRWVAVLEPDHDALPALLPHFLRRFGASPFALVDVGRAYALAAPDFASRNISEGRGASGSDAPGSDARGTTARDGGAESPIPELEDFVMVQGEVAFALVPPTLGEEAELFRRYCAAVENPARRNAALQRRLMPRRYWKHLVELGPEARGD